ncbi:hypothetical protein BDN72DRAFT_953354 [Pluteus cervinus]|uniref:Uncharacterized protein n=1 Tax=Pluteus cervinus TaxID=181527 RepID=A0ACD3BG15_9AGAR|nr:hypothetical protein BDN72DRAFT_953354 [Pluteus cervinus]
MAHSESETTTAPGLTGQDVKGIVAEAVEQVNAEELSPPKVNGLATPDQDAGETNSRLATTTTEASAAPIRPTLVQLGSNSSQSSTPTTNASQPKRFSAVNVNKKFFKNASSSATTPVSSGSTATKATNSTSSRPSSQPTPTHSKLVTAKLTATPASSTTTGPGWSRPSSATPPVASGITTLPNAASASPSAPAASVTAQPSTAPQLPVAGKVIQPQPRSALLQTGVAPKDAIAGRPVWGNVKPVVNPAPHPDLQDQSDFPTAAEVAQVSTTTRKTKSPETKATPDAAAPPKPTRSEEADTFRGLHLDPNAHHWDEMEEDDDNFLDGVIEFGDGRQYKVEQAEDAPPISQSSTADPPANTSTAVSVSKGDRFGDDIGRSWPRSRTSPTSSVKDSTGLPASVSTSPRVTTHSLQSAQDHSRVLFNERSNRLEPYSGTRGGSQIKRGGYEASLSPTESRHSRDGQVTSPSRSHFQTGFRQGTTDTHQPSFERRPRDREPSRNTSMGPPPSPRLTREGLPPRPQPMISKDAPNDSRGRRSSTSSSHLRPLSSRESVRQLPPHLSELPAASSQRQVSPHDSRRLPSSNGARPPSPRRPSRSPAVRTTALPSATAPSLSAPDLDEARKDVMQTAAARAKQRREQEELEREQAKERARLKALGLEERMKKAAQEKEVPLSPAQTKEVLSVIEDAISGATGPDTAETSHTQPSPIIPKSHLGRPPSIRGTPRPGFQDRRVSISSNTQPSIADLEGSWRSKAPPRAQPPPAPSTTEPVKLASDSGHEDLAPKPGEDVEVIDFSDLGKLVGAKEAEIAAPVEKTNEPQSFKPKARPVASDFFDDKSAKAEEPPKGDWATWRRDRQQGQSDQKTDGPDSTSQEQPPATDHPIIPPSSSAPQLHSHRPPRSQYTEAAMSALDDAMSRIKGAIHGMQAGESQKEIHKPEPDTSSHTPAEVKPIVQKDRWVPPALRPRDDSEREGYEEGTTSCEPPLSPKALLPIISLPPRASAPHNFVHRRQLQLFFQSTPVRWDILSFDPPVEGMSRVDFSLVEVLHRRQPVGYRGKWKYRVHLPRTRGTGSYGPRVNIPSQSKPSPFAFGRASAASEVSSWRRAAEPKIEESGEASLDTTSRSPPPVTRTPLPPADGSDADPAKKDANASRFRTHAKMPEGSVVAFFRDNRVDTVNGDSKGAVSFIVNSEIDEGQKPASSSNASVVLPKTDVAEHGLLELPSYVKPAEVQPEKPQETKVPSPAIAKLEETPAVITNSSSAMQDRQSSWSRAPMNLPVKESPSRLPDPEHLKAVWSQTSVRAGLQTVNSLEGIVDDLVPFTLPEMKSEDGETPPPVASGPTRMSLHDVTRTFQTVPNANTTNSAPHKNPLSPPLTNAPVARPPAYNYPVPPPNNMRSGYPTTYSPMMSHSPTPVMYPHPMASSPVPHRMTAGNHSPLYSQPVWVPMTGTPQNPNNAMMRPMGSPYAHQMMAYPVQQQQPTGQAMYGHPPPQAPANVQSQQHQNGGQVNRNRNVPFMSPVMSPAASMYGSSPVLMQPPVMPVHQQPNHAYMPMQQPPPRGQGRPDNGHMSMMQQPPQPIHPPAHAFQRHW